MNLPTFSSRTAEASTSDAVRAPVLPKVNLLPQEIVEAKRFRRFQLAMAAAGVGAVAVVALLGMNAHSSVASARSNLDQAQAEQSSLQNQLTGLQSVQDVYNQVAAKQAMLVQAMGPEVRWSYYLTDLSLKVPDHVWLTQVTATETAGTSAPASPAGATALTPAGIGSVTFAGVAFAHDDVANLLDSLAKERGYANVYFTNSTKTKLGARDVVNFQASVSLTQGALSGRYSKVEG